MELNCLLTLYLILAPLGVPSHSAQQTLSGTCDTKSISINIVANGILRIENDYREYQIVLPARVDKLWLTYKLGDEYAYAGNCPASAHPYADSFCQRIMTRIGLIGWQ